MTTNFRKIRLVLQRVFALCEPLAKRTFFLFFCLGPLICFSLASCAMPLKTARELQEAAPVAAYQGFANFPYEKLTLKERRFFRIDEHSPAFDFATGKSFFRAFALPQSPTPYTVTLRSYLVGQPLKSGYVFAPRVILLDDSFTVTRTLGSEYFHQARDRFDTMGRLEVLEGTTRIDQSARDERYLIIMTTKEALKEATIMTKPVYTTGLWLPDWPDPGIYPTGEVRKIWVSNSPVGNLRIILK